MEGVNFKSVSMMVEEKTEKKAGYLGLKVDSLRRIIR